MIYATLLMLTIATFTHENVADSVYTPDYASGLSSEDDIIRERKNYFESEENPCPKECYPDSTHAIASAKNRYKKPHKQVVRGQVSNSFICKKYPKSCRGLGQWVKYNRRLWTAE